MLHPLTNPSPLETMKTMIADFRVNVFNSFGSSSTTGEIAIAEVAPARTPVAEVEIMWGPSFIDEDLVARLDALRQQGFPPLPGAAALDG